MFSDSGYVLGPLGTNIDFLHNLSTLWGDLGSSLQLLMESLPPRVMDTVRFPSAGKRCAAGLRKEVLQLVTNPHTQVFSFPPLEPVHLANNKSTKHWTFLLCLQQHLVVPLIILRNQSSGLWVYTENRSRSHATAWIQMKLWHPRSHTVQLMWTWNE